MLAGFSQNVEKWSMWAGNCHLCASLGIATSPPQAFTACQAAPVLDELKRWTGVDFLISWKEMLQIALSLDSEPSESHQPHHQQIGKEQG